MVGFTLAIDTRSAAISATREPEARGAPVGDDTYTASLRTLRADPVRGLEDAASPAPNTHATLTEVTTRRESIDEHPSSLVC
jgi:hypothetical protein